MPAARVAPMCCRHEIGVPQTESTSPVISNTTDNDSTSSSSFDSRTSLTPYQRAIHKLNYDERWQKEIAFGRRIGFYRFQGELGTGNFSQVKMALHCLTKEKVAVKILNKAKLDQKTQRMLCREISSMEELHHPNIIRLFEVIETLSKIYLVMEMASGGELFQHISSEGPFTESEAKPLFAQMVAAVDHMHQHNIIHRDIKAENVFFSSPSTIKLGDFGFSTQLHRLDVMLNTFCGSPPYAAPELFRDESYTGPHVDIWALGVLLYFLVTGSMPFKAQTVSSLKKLILDGQYTLPSYLSDSCCHLIDSLLHQEPRERWSIAQIKDSDWLRGQNFPKEFAKPDMTLLSTRDELSDDERAARMQLLELGVTEEMIADSAVKGMYCSVTGLYRITMHKVQWSSKHADKPQQQNQDQRMVSAANVVCPSPNLLPSGMKRFTFKDNILTPKKHKSRTCVIL